MFSQQGFKGSSREHTESDLRCYLAWCAEHGLDPLAAQRPHLELYIRWMQEIRRFKPSTVSRRFSVAAGFYRTCVLDGTLEHSPAEHVRRPAVPPEPSALGFTHLQFEALLTAARESPDPCDFALVAMLGLIGLRIFEAASADIGDLGEEHGHRVLRVCGKGTKVVLVPLPPAVGRAIDRAIGGRVRGPILFNSHGSPLTVTLPMRPVLCTVARLGTDLLLQGVDHGGRGCARIVIGRRPDGPPEPAGVVMDRDPAYAARHRLGGDAGHQGDPETGGDEPESGGPVAGCEGDPRLGDAGPCAELGGVAGTGPDDPPLVCELVGFDPFPDGEGV